MKGTYRNVLFRLAGEDYAAKALIFIPGVGVNITIEKGGEFKTFRIVGVDQQVGRVVVDIEEPSDHA